MAELVAVVDDLSLKEYVYFFSQSISYYKQERKNLLNNLVHSISVHKPASYSLTTRNPLWSYAKYGKVVLSWL